MYGYINYIRYNYIHNKKAVKNYNKEGDVMKGKKNISIGFILLIIFVIGMILFFIPQENRELFIDFINNIREEETIEEKKEAKTIASIPINHEIDGIGLYEDDIVVLENKILSRFKIDGSIKWEESFNLDQPILSFGEDRIYLSDKVTGEIYILDSEGKILDKKELNMRIKNLIVDFNNILVHTRDEDTDEEGIKIFSKDGDIAIDFLVEDGNILTYSIAKNKEKYMVSILDLRKDKLKSSIEVFEIDGKELYNHIFNDEIILYSSFIGQDKLLIMSDNYLYLLEEQNILWEKKLQLIKDIEIYNGRINILYSNTLEVLSPEGETESKYSFTEEYNKMSLWDDLVVLYGDEYVIGLEDGKEIFKYNLNEEILNVINNGSNLLIIYKDKIDILSL